MEKIRNFVGEVYGQLPPAPQTRLLKALFELCRSAQEAGGNPVTSCLANLDHVITEA